jgi:hypothetical protein
MRRVVIVALAALLLVGAASVAGGASRTRQLAEDAMALEQAWTSWLLGGSSNALLAEDFCGEGVDGRFFLTLGLGTGATELACEIPAGTEAVASPFGAFTWAPTDGENGTQLFNAALGFLDGVVPRSVKVMVDGAALPKEPMLCSHPFDMALEPGNSLQQIDPDVEGDSTKVVTCAWIYVVGPMSPGEHTIDVTGKVKGSPPYELRYNVTVP